MTTKGHAAVPAKSSRISRCREVINNWKSTIEVGGVVFALLISSGALMISSKANRLTRTALRIQETEFRLRTRPYIVLGLHPVEITGPATSADGKVQNHVLMVKLRNPTDIPAFDVRFAATVVVDNKAGPTNEVPPKSVSPFGKVAIFRDDEPRYPIAVTDEAYALLDVADHSISADIEVTYYGVLQKTLLYKTNIRLVYDHADKNFFVADLDPK